MAIRSEFYQDDWIYITLTLRGPLKEVVSGTDGTQFLLWKRCENVFDTVVLCSNQLR